MNAEKANYIMEKGHPVREKILKKIIDFKVWYCLQKIYHRIRVDAGNRHKHSSYTVDEDLAFRVAEVLESQGFKVHIESVFEYWLRDDLYSITIYW